MRLFSTKNRAFHLGPFPMERLRRTHEPPDLSAIPAPEPLEFNRQTDPHNIVNAMRDYQAMLDAIRDGLVNPVVGKFPDDPVERARHLKSFGYFQDVPMAGICALPDAARLETPHQNPDIARLAHLLQTRQTKTLASGIDLIMADLKDSMAAPSQGIAAHTHALVFLYNYNRDPGVGEVGCDWLKDAQAHRAGLLASETAVVLANYLRSLGYLAKAHTPTSTDVNLAAMAVASGLATWEDGALDNPFVGGRFQVSVVTTNLEIAPDLPLVPKARQASGGLAWKIGFGVQKSALNVDPYAKRDYMNGPHPFETLKRVDTPTTFIDEPRVPRVPKRADMFARAQFGDLGPAAQKVATGGYYVRKSAAASALRRPLGAFVLLQDGPWADHVPAFAKNPQTNAENIKAASYFLGADAVGISRCPSWAWYSHDAAGDPIDPPHDQAISMIIDQGFETTEGSSGDDWIAVTQSMRAYMRFSLLGSVIAQHIRNLGYSAKAHTVLDGEVLQPPLLLLSGLGEVSRIGEVIVNPFLGPRLKSGVVTTDMPLARDKPIDFGMQAFCEACNKCARECPSGAITAGPKLMFNGYEIWKSDSQKCTNYRIHNKGGAMCGRCMKTCPWNVEGLALEGPIRWTAMNIPQMAPVLARADDWVGNGSINPTKRWWWDLALNDAGGYDVLDRDVPVNTRELQRDLDLQYADQTLAVYPADLAPAPWPFPFPMDREAGIVAYNQMITADEYKRRLAAGEVEGLAHRSRDPGDAPVIAAVISKVEDMADGVTKYEFQASDGSDLPAWSAGAHLDIVVAPEYLRQYSMSGNPTDRSCYQIGVLREDGGRGGSKLLHRIFTKGRRVFISKPINHFPRVTGAKKHLFFGGGIGVTPMIAMAHEAHQLGEEFTLHYSTSSRKNAGFLHDLANVPWVDRVQLHVSDENSRADLEQIIPAYANGTHIYTCGPDAYMAAVLDAATKAGFPDEAQHLEYFSVPEIPEYENHPFVLRLAKSGQELLVAAHETAADVLSRSGYKVDLKCSDGLCGVCKCGLVSGDVEHRDFVLSKAQQRSQIILCQSRAKDQGGVIELDL